jgi:hypothetical protein
LLKEDFEKFTKVIEQVDVSKYPVDASALDFFASNNQDREFDIWKFWINPREKRSSFRPLIISEISHWLIDTYIIIMLDNDFSTNTMEILITKNSTKSIEIYLINELLGSLVNVENKYQLKIKELYTIIDEQLQV